MRRNSMKIQYVLTTVLSAMAFGCDGGGESGGGDGGDGGGMTTVGNVQSYPVSDFETKSTTTGLFDGYSEDAGNMWKVAWFTYTDVADMKSDGATIFPPEHMAFSALEDPTSKGTGPHIAEAKGTGFKSWGAGMGFNFVSPPEGTTTPPAATSLAPFLGVSFWLKAIAPTTGTVKVKIVDRQNTPVDRGGTCTAGMPTPAARCDDVFVFVATPTADWQFFKPTWAEFKQEGWGMLPFPGPELGGVIGIQFQVGANLTFDYAVDDVGLITSMSDPAAMP